MKMIKILVIPLFIMMVAMVIRFQFPSFPLEILTTVIIFAALYGVTLTAFDEKVS